MLRRGRPARRRAFAGALLAGCACAAVAGCSDFTLVEVTPTPTILSLPSLPPIGFNHRFGNTPVASADAFRLERALFAQRTFWEVAIRTDPVLAGYVPLGDKQQVASARHRATDLYLVIATEDGHTILGMLAFHTHAGQAAYCEALLKAARSFGYDNLTSAYVLVYFTESDEHAKLSWTPRNGYSYSVYDNDLRGTSLVPTASQTPLPTPMPPPRTG